MRAYMRERKNKKRIDRYKIIWYDGYINWTIGRKKMIRMVSREVAIEEIISFLKRQRSELVISHYKDILRNGCTGYSNYTNSELEQEWDTCYTEKVRICD